MSYQPVLEKFTRFADDIYSLKIEGEKKALNVTNEHPFYTKIYRDGISTDAEWKEVKNLKANDQIKLASGNWAKILDVKFKGKGQVYNFSVAENHDYFVGDSRLLTHNSCPNPYGRLGKPTTQEHIEQVATELESRGWTITGGGGSLPEEYLAGVNGGRRGSSFVDITATKNGKTLRVNTVDTYVDGVTATTREANNAARIRLQRPGEHLLLIPKPK